MMVSLPPTIRRGFAMLRKQLTNGLKRLEWPKTQSAAEAHEGLTELISTLDYFENELIEAIEKDPNYNPDPWNDDDLVILTSSIVVGGQP